MHLRKSLSRASVFFALLIVPIFCSATSIRQLHIDHVFDDAEVVFAGTVVNSEARWNESKSRIHTYITFAVDDLIKGKLESRDLELRFSGGQVGEIREEVQAMVYPQLGETGIYFVERLDRPLINPLVGWTQGHFKQKKVNGEMRLFTAADEAVTGVASQQGKKALINTLSDGNALGIDTSDEHNKALYVEEFVNSLKARLLAD